MFTSSPTQPRRHILGIDSGSSSLKVGLYGLGATDEQLLIEGAVEALDVADGTLKLCDYREKPTRETERSLTGTTPIAAVLNAMRELAVPIDAVGHRFVYGGIEHEVPARVDAALLASLATLAPFDPLHLPAALAAVREFSTALPLVPQVICFDTAFHRRMPAVAQRLPLPRELWSEGLRRYGFHGLSYESIVRALGPTGVRGRLIVAHIGNGASMAAMRDGRPIDTTMGFSPLGGLMMGTRPGDLDPGALLYLLRAGRYTSAELDDVLIHRSGLLGVSRLSADMRTLLERRGTDAHAAEAVELFVYQAKKQLGGLAGVLGGIDTLVFTGGIGERSATIRTEIAAGLAHLGVELDPAQNGAGAGIISATDARVTVRVMPAQENLLVARHTYTTLFAPPDAGTDDEGAFSLANGAGHPSFPR